ncbi:hypothetical protein RND71_038491 [Anisodus tanguticus]|uniref:Uncharacterized protein n=1 Tax=Anisodus tanguticus TaxID=243964 RepID=A0AAE1QZT9_9SOLA|nr:hypothetical protein RND71_038491 [Anisodus tanguticus]
MSSSNDEVNACRDIVLYVPPIPIVNNVGTIIVPEKLIERKRRLVTTKIIVKDDVNFLIVPSEGEADLYTIKLKKNKEESSDPHELNRKYYEMLHGWTAERRQRQNGVCDTVGIEEKYSKKRKGESSILVRESATKKHKNNEHHSYDKSWVAKFLEDAGNNFMKMNNKHKVKSCNGVDLLRQILAPKGKNSEEDEDEEEEVVLVVCLAKYEESPFLPHAPTHSQDPLSVVPKDKISPVEAAEDFYADAAVEEMARDNPSTEANPADDSEVLVEIVPKDVLLQYFGSVDIAPAQSSPVSIHRERVDESLAKGIPTSKKEFHALRASLFRLSKETENSPILATAYNDMALALNNLFALHKMAKNNHDEAVAALQHLGSLLQKKKHIQTFFNEKVGSERLAQLENEWTVWKNRLTQATPTLPASFSKVASEGTYYSVMATHLPVDPVAQLSTDILMDLQSEGIAASVTQEVLPAAKQQQEDIQAADT